MSRTWLLFEIIYIYFAVVFTTPCNRLVIFIIRLHLIMHFSNFNLSILCQCLMSSNKVHTKFISFKGLIQSAATMNILTKNLRNVQYVKMEVWDGIVKHTVCQDSLVISVLRHASVKRTCVIYRLGVSHHIMRHHPSKL